MSQKPINNPPPPGLSLGDIYYVLFRHKWKILIISVLGLLAALLLPRVMTPPFQSEAEIMIRYVVENKSPGQTASDDARIKSPDEGGASIVNSEIQILTSLDLCQQIADDIGPEKILAKAGGGKEREAAAALIHRNLIVSVPNRSSVIQVVFQHPDPTMVQPVLRQLLDSYYKRHAEVHRPVVDDFLTQETDRLRSQLAQTENALRAAKTNAGIVSIDDAKKSYSEQLSQLRLEVFSTQAELAERQAAIAEISKTANVKPVPVTNAVPAANSVPQEKTVEYRRVLNLLDGLVKREQDLSLQFTSENAQVRGVREQIAGYQKTRTDLEKEFPGLVSVAEETKTKHFDLATGGQLDLTAERAKVSALATKISVLTNQLAQVQRDASALDSIEASITELQRKKELEEQNYKYFSANLEQARIDEALGATRSSNISIIQEPSPPFRDTKKINKMRLGAAFGGLAVALALAFFIELYLDRSIRRSSQVGSQLHAPLFISIPRLAAKASRSGKNAKLLPASSNGSGASANANGSSENGQAIQNGLAMNGHANGSGIRMQARPFYETLRDRLILYFEANNLTHKPKLVAVTSCEIGSGVTTSAAGLAASLSETGEGNVLLVDMSGHEPEAHHFYKGRLDCGLEDALEMEKRDGAMVQENLYVVSESTKDDKLPQVLPKRFKHLIPKLRASDFDYIIFDMPPVSQISPTPRLAQFMDIVFLVVESEKTNRDIAKHAASLLADSKANVGIILNKTKAYVPKRLRQDL